MQAKFLVAGDCISRPIVALEQGPLCLRAAVVEDRIAGQLDLDLAVDALHGADEHMVGADVGRRWVYGVTRSSPMRGPMVSASRTTTQPPRVFHVVTSVLVPGS